MQTQQTEIEMIDVDSSNLAQVGYDRKSKVLRLKFHDGREYYDFMNVPPRVHRGLMDAQSKGTFFRQHVQYRFTFRKTLS